MPKEMENEQSQEPQAPSSAELIESALGGDSLTDYLGGEEPPVSTTEPEPDAPTVTPEDAEVMRERLKALEENARTQHANWNQEHMARLQAENFVGALQQARHQEMAAAQQAAALAPPEFQTDWNEVADDPEKLGQEIERQNKAYADWAAQRTMAAVWPYVQQYQGQQAQFNAVLHSSVEGLLDKGRETLQRSHGVSYEDFEQYRPQIKAAFTNMGPEGISMLAESDNIVSSYAILAVKDGKPFNAAPSEPAPLHADSAPSRRNITPSLKQTPPELQNLWSKMKPAFGFDAPTLEDMQEAGVDISRYQKG